jgi:hypothetical protein
MMVVKEGFLTLLYLTLDVKNAHGMIKTSKNISHMELPCQCLT